MQRPGWQALPPQDPFLSPDCFTCIQSKGFMVSAQPHLLIFARHPRLGRGKRRLAAQVGDSLAHRWYCAQLGALVRRLAAPGRWRLVLALETGPAMWPGHPRLPVILQDRLAGPNADLGARMLACIAPFAPGPTLLIGADVLGIERCDIAHLFNALERPGSLLAPASDGGFWAFGHRGPALPPRALEGIAWSLATTGHAAQQALGARLLPREKADLDRLERSADPASPPPAAHITFAGAQPRVPLMPLLSL